MGNGTKPRRLAAIDVGTNSIRLVVAEGSSDGTYRVLDDEKAVTRLGRGLAKGNRLHPDAIEDSLVAIARMKSIAEGYGVSSIRCIGTCAVREASNGAQFCQEVLERTRITLEPISGEEEARLAFISASYAFDLREVSSGIADIGGGSTELVLASGGVLDQVYTVPLGAVRLTEEFAGVEQAGNEAAYTQLRRRIRDVLKREVGEPPFVPQFVVGTGGTFTTLAAISMHRGAVPREGGMLPFATRGYELQRSELRHTLDWLRQLPVKARMRVPGLSPDRAEIIIAGLAIAEGVMRHLGVNTARVHDRGIRDGLLLTMLREGSDDEKIRRPAPVDRAHAVRQFAGKCRYEEQHSQHVAELACQIFDQIEKQAPDRLSDAQGAWGREILHSAAVLHDVGYFINYAKHHKHSYHLIVHSDLQGFTHRELEIIANIARYHRRSEPKMRHPNFAKLGEADRGIVRRLAGILRIADGLDRTHTQTVASVHVRLSEREASFLLEGAEEPVVDSWGAARKAKLFAKEFGLEPRFEWVGPRAGSAFDRETQDAPRLPQATTP
ncbi:MAG: Ppx/GppA phosphatase family protein [Planctomycetota bacterium]|nr:Ppx/GppA phosphatase family protein [Planctomycetota bacterium]